MEKNEENQKNCNQFKLALDSWSKYVNVEW